jgi:hypothetical protein
MLSLLPHEPVYRLRAVERADSVGDTVRTWDAPERTRIRGADIQEVASTSDGVTVVRSNNERRLLIDGPRPDLTELDRIEYRGEVWRIDGEPLTKPALAMDTLTVAKLVRHVTR